LFTAGDADAVAGVLMKLAGMRAYMRTRTLDGTVSADLLDGLGMTAEQVESMYRLLAIAKYDERYVIPTAYAKDAAALEAQATAATDAGCSLDCEGGPGMGEPAGVGATVERFSLVKDGDDVRPGRAGLFTRRTDGRRGLNLSVRPQRSES
jgi:nitrate reductase beta subunit